MDLIWLAPAGALIALLFAGYNALKVKRADEGNEKVKELLVSLKEQIFRYKYEFLKELEDPTRLVREHDEIIKAIGESRADKAVELIRMHIDSQAIAIYRKLK